jgi:hypothetical protein
MATKKKKAKMPTKPSSPATAPKKPKKEAPTKAAKKKVAPNKPKPAAKKHAAPKTKTAKTPAIPRPKTFAEKLRDANARIDVPGDDVENGADEVGGADERDLGDTEEVEGDADGTNERE